VHLDFASTPSKLSIMLLRKKGGRGVLKYSEIKENLIPVALDNDECLFSFHDLQKDDQRKQRHLLCKIRV